MDILSVMVNLDCWFDTHLCREWQWGLACGALSYVNWCRKLRSGSPTVSKSRNRADCQYACICTLSALDCGRDVTSHFESCLDSPTVMDYNWEIVDQDKPCLLYITPVGTFRHSHRKETRTLFSPHFATVIKDSNRRPLKRVIGFIRLSWLTVLNCSSSWKEVREGTQAKTWSRNHGGCGLPAGSEAHTLLAFWYSLRPPAVTVARLSSIH